MSDILIVGGGIVGMLVARELAQAGARVVLIEQGETGRESSWAGGGILSPLYPWRYPPAVTALAAWSQAVYPALCADLLAETGIDPELTPGGLLILDTEERDPALAWARSGAVAMERLATAEIRAQAPGLGEPPSEALWLPQIAQVRNPRLVKSVRRSLEGRIEIREREAVLELTVDADARRIVGVRTAQGERPADRVVVCAGAWTARLLDGLGLGLEIRPVRGQMILFLTRPGLIRRMVLARDRYVIPRRDGQVLVGSTLEHSGFDKAATAEAREELSRCAVALFPGLRHAEVGAHWSGLRPGSPNGIPYIGPHPTIAGLFVNAGHFRNGLVCAPASARLAADLILGHPPILDPAPYALDADR